MDPDNLKLPMTHSLLFQDLIVRGHKLIFAKADDSALALTSYGDYLYDNLILLSPKTEDFGGSIDVAAVLDFVDSGRNLLLVATPDASDSVREIALECGITMVEDDRIFVQDHFFHHSTFDDGNHTLVISDDIVAPDIVFGTVCRHHLRRIGMAQPQARSDAFSQERKEGRPQIIPTWLPAITSAAPHPRHSLPSKVQTPPFRRIPHSLCRQRGCAPINLGHRRGRAGPGPSCTAGPGSRRRGGTRWSCRCCGPPPRRTPW